MQRAAIFLFCLFTAATAAAQKPTPAAGSPDAVVVRFYTWYLSRGRSAHPALADFLTEKFLRKASRQESEDEADIFLASQDTPPPPGSRIRIARSRVSGERAVVFVALGGSAREPGSILKVNLLRENGAWRIDRVGVPL